MWNQNGNGQGNGYGQNDVYDRLNNARQITNRDPYIEAGTHTLAVISLEEVQTQDKGMMVRGTFLVLDSTSARPGTKVGNVWFLQKPPPKPGMVTDSDRFADFCMRLKGAPAGYAIGADIRVLLRDRAADQLARGQVIRVVGINKTAKSTGKTFCELSWSNLPQTPQQIAEQRAKIESTPGLIEAAAPQQQYQQQYQQQPQAPQGYPQPPQTYGQQPGVGYGAQQPQAPQGVPPGGFLANVPPQGNNGGNNGAPPAQGGW